MYAFGVDIGGTGIKSGIVDKKGKVVVRSYIPTDCEAGYQKVVKDIAEQLVALSEESGIAIKDIAGIGVGCPGAIDGKRGTVDYSNNIKWEDAFFLDELKK